MPDLDQIADEALASFLPADYTVHWLPAGHAEEARGDTYTTAGPKELWVPHPTTPDTLLVLLHELGHIVHKDPGISSGLAEMFGSAEAAEDSGQPPHAECLASHWARDYMTARGVAVTPECWDWVRQQWQNEEQARNETITKE